MSRTWFSLDGLGLLLGSAVLLLAGCQDQQPEPVAPQFAKAKPPRTLTVTGAGTGFGTVTAPAYGETPELICAIGAGTNDPLECSRTYGWKTVVVLTAAADPGSTFTGWTGACSGTSPECRVTMTQSRDVRAAFSGSGVASYVLNLSGSGTGNRHGAEPDRAQPGHQLHRHERHGWEHWVQCVLSPGHGGHAHRHSGDQQHVCGLGR